jgi:serine/threonine-protein kinase RsbW
LAERDRAEEELAEATDGIRKLSALIPASSSCRLNVVIPADPGAISAVSDGVMQVIREKRCAEGHEVEVEIAVKEALANAIKHGCGNDRSKSVQCCVAVEDDGELLIVVRDPGPGFDPAKVANPLVGAGLMKESGRGVFFINQFMDDVRYEDGGRELHMRKRARAQG